MNKPDVTIFADASVDHESGAAGWACWIKGDGSNSVLHSGAFREPVGNSTNAELAALANALAVAKAIGQLRGRVMLQSDCSAALAMIRTIAGAEDSPAERGLRVGKWRKKPEKMYRPAVKVIQSVIQDTGIKLVVRHVKGHQAGGGRNWVNRQCDRLAKKHMRDLRRQLNAVQADLPGTDVIPDRGRDRTPNKEPEHQAERDGRPHRCGECGNRVEVGIPGQIGEHRVCDQIEREQPSLRAAAPAPRGMRPGNASADDHQEKDPCRAICRDRHEAIDEVHRGLPVRIVS